MDPVNTEDLKTEQNANIKQGSIGGEDVKKTIKTVSVW